MKKEIHSRIRTLMREEGIWSRCIQLKVYTIDELLEEVGEEKFSPELKRLLRENVHRVQMYLDERILEPLQTSSTS